MRAFIYVGGRIFPDAIHERPKEGDLILAADSGLRNALDMGETPSVFIGDCDSFPESRIPAGIDKILLKPEKDSTDTQVAVEVALNRGADDIILIGGLDGRLDHTFSNLFILEDLYERHIPAVITNGQNRVRYLRDTSVLIPRSPYRYLSLLTLDPVAKGVDISGCRYPLKNAKIKRSLQFAVSNELTGNCALISVRKGSLFIMETRDL
ncbi:MAG: thiamine diphosphokinase [Clostridia bacterium]|nr:thiamine diphosphokinase [Clostridia bacterium]